MSPKNILNFHSYATYRSALTTLTLRWNLKESKKKLSHSRPSSQARCQCRHGLNYRACLIIPLLFPAAVWMASNIWVIWIHIEISTQVWSTFKRVVGKLAKHKFPLYLILDIITSYTRARARAAKKDLCSNGHETRYSKLRYRNGLSPRLYSDHTLDRHEWERGKLLWQLHRELRAKKFVRYSFAKEIGSTNHSRVG